MAYDTQQQHPEQQITNGNRQGLNLQQHGDYPILINRDLE